MVWCGVQRKRGTRRIYFFSFIFQQQEETKFYSVFCCLLLVFCMQDGWEKLRTNEREIQVDNNMEIKVKVQE